MNGFDPIEWALAAMGFSMAFLGIVVGVCLLVDFFRKDRP